MRVLVWNLYHGRRKPGDGRSSLNEFAAAIDGWEWDVALLQEVPPWWPAQLARATDAQERSVLTSRNWGLPVRRAIAARNPDLLGSWGGGANTILARDEITDHRSARLACLPERRYLHAVALADGPWVGNLHLTVAPKRRTRAEAERSAALMRSWAAGTPFVLGGDFNLTRPEIAGLHHVGGHHVDHVFTSDRHRPVPVELLDAGNLSDHRPFLARL